MKVFDLSEVFGEIVAFENTPWSSRAGHGQLQSQLGFDADGGDGVISENHFGFVGIDSAPSEATLSIGIGRQSRTATGGLGELVSF